MTRLRQARRDAAASRKRGNPKRDGVSKTGDVKKKRKRRADDDSPADDGSDAGRMKKDRSRSQGRVKMNPMMGLRMGQKKKGPEVRQGATSGLVSSRKRMGLLVITANGCLYRRDRWSSARVAHYLSFGTLCC